MPEFTTMLSDLALGESPRWHDDHLVFADWGARWVVSVDARGGRQDLFPVDAMPFCLDRLPDGSMIVVASGALLVRGARGALTTYADLTELSDKPWNDLVVDGRGNTYVNTIGFRFPDEEFAPGSVALVAADRSVRLVADDLAFPNGMAVLPDGRTLVVAESYGAALTAFDIAPDGSLSRRRVWADLRGAAPDGICADASGAVWFAEVPGRRCVRVREGGEVLEEIVSDLGCFSCALGGADRRTLFVTAAAWPEAMTPGSRTGRLLTAEVAVPGAGWPA